MLLFDIRTVVFVCFLSSLLCAHMPQLILCHVHDIPFPVFMSHMYFRFFLILLVTFEVSSHKWSSIPNYLNKVRGWISFGLYCKLSAVHVWPMRNLDFGYGLALDFGLDHTQLVNWQWQCALIAAVQCTPYFLLLYSLYCISNFFWNILECSLLCVQFYLLSPPPAMIEGCGKTTEVP